VNAVAKLPPKPGITLDSFVKEWRSSVSVNLKGSTIRAAESHLRAHILPKLGSLPLTEINTKAVQCFVAYLATGGRSRKTVENVLLTLSSILRTAKAWDYACGNLSLANITLPREGVRKEQRCFIDEEVGKIIAAAPEPFGTILAVTSVLGLRIGEVLALRVCDLDFKRKLIRVRQSVDAATRNVQAPTFPCRHSLKLGFAPSFRSTEAKVSCYLSIAMGAHFSKQATRKAASPALGEVRHSAWWLPFHASRCRQFPACRRSNPGCSAEATETQ
jgi:Phage integrase, N-terminal SAM-like domain